MKTTRMKSVKRDVNVVTRGLRTSARVLMAWVNEPSDKDVVKRRLLIILGVPAGFIFLGSKYPVVAITGGLVLFFVTVFWFARTEDQKMTLSVSDFDGPYRYAGRVVDFEELLRALVRAHPSATLEDLAEHIFEAFEGPDLSDGELAAQMRLYGIAHPEIPGPSPTVADGPVSSGETAGQDHVEGVPEGVESPQGRGKAHHLVVSLASAARRYAGSSTETKGKTDDRPEEQGAGSLDQTERRHEEQGTDAGEGDGRGAPVRGPEAGQEERGGLPDQDGRHPQDAPKVA
jgi:hypothetical protein